MNSAIEDEISSINAIYGDDTISLKDVSTLTLVLRLPTHKSTALRLEFPSDYPDAPPSVIGLETLGDDLPKGAGHAILETVRCVLARVYKPGEACIYDLLEETGDALQNHELFAQSQHLVEQDETIRPRATEASSTADIGPEPPWIVSDPITEKKSVFVARAAVVSSPAQARGYLRHLLATDKKAAKATHNINAWRIKGEHDIVYQDCDDDGEDAAGGRVLHLMQLMDVWNVMVVVSRWYGGVLLGPDRFRIINSAARDALVKAGFAQEGEGQGRKKGKK